MDLSRRRRIIVLIFSLLFDVGDLDSLIEDTDFPSRTKAFLAAVGDSAGDYPKKERKLLSLFINSFCSLILECTPDSHLATYLDPS